MVTRKPVIGIMGAGEGATPTDTELAAQHGQLVAENGWVVLTGGRAAGVMQAASQGAKRVADSLVVGVLPSQSGSVSPYVDVAIFTGLGNARNVVNVLSSDVVVACGVFGPGTTSEVALALKSGRSVVLLAPSREAEAFFLTLSPSCRVARTPQQAISVIAEGLSTRGKGGAA
jgi:uncharacterized protein (TIGR00725 family)